MGEWTGLKGNRVPEKVLMAQLREKYGPDYNGPGEHPRPTRRTLERKRAEAEAVHGDPFASWADRERAGRMLQDVISPPSPDPKGLYRLSRGAGSNTRKSEPSGWQPGITPRGGVNNHIARGEAVVGTGKPPGA